jgi:hypothetical protein
MGRQRERYVGMTPLRSFRLLKTLIRLEVREAKEGRHHHELSTAIGMLDESVLGAIQKAGKR